MLALMRYGLLALTLALAACRDGSPAAAADAAPSPATSMQA
ncbi:MAG: hypothetical protein JWP87_6538, partial [Labilithrix sp.]|nr:hypothetical protein [Labilithrix sp.]